MSKVIHVDSETHKKAKDYCTAKDRKMSEWIAEVIEAELLRNTKGIDVYRELARLKQAMTDAPKDVVREVVRYLPAQQVEIKDLPKTVPRPKYLQGSEPWAKPPFWTSETNDNET